MTSTTLEQQRAASALQRVNELAGRPDDFKKPYRAYVDRLGPAIVMNGLGQALATERAAAGANPNPMSPREQAHHQLYEGLNRWLCREDGGVYPASSQDLLQAITENNESLYLRAQAEALAWLGWHKKFCRATFPQGEGDDL